MKHTILIENGRWYTYFIKDDTEDIIFCSPPINKLSRLLYAVDDKKMKLFLDIDQEHYNTYLKKCKILLEDNKYITYKKTQKEHPELLI